MNISTNNYQYTRMISGEIPSYISKVHTREEFLSEIDSTIKKNLKTNGHTLEELLEMTCEEGRNATFKFVGENKLYSFDEFVVDMSKRLNLHDRNTSNTKEANGEFQNKVLKCVSAGEQNVILCSDALMSYGSPQTGESVSIYKADNYSEDNPIYIIKGLDANGNEFEQEIDASTINPNHCSYNELMVLNLETGHTSPSDYLHAVAVRDKAGVDSYFDKTDYIECIQMIMDDQKAMGNWASYLSYDKWLQSLLNHVSENGGDYGY